MCPTVGVFRHTGTIHITLVVSGPILVCHASATNSSLHHKRANVGNQACKHSSHRYRHSISTKWAGSSACGYGSLVLKPCAALVALLVRRGKGGSVKIHQFLLANLVHLLASYNAGEQMALLELLFRTVNNRGSSLGSQRISILQLGSLGSVIAQNARLVQLVNAIGSLLHLNVNIFELAKQVAVSILVCIVFKFQFSRLASIVRLKKLGHSFANAITLRF